MARGGTSEQQREKGLASWRDRDPREAMAKVRQAGMVKQLRDVAPDLAEQLETRLAVKGACND